MDHARTLEFAIDCARAAGRIVMRYFGVVPDVQEKGRLDLVTRADLESEQLLIEEIETRFPDHAVHGEERGSVARVRYNWFVDPLDGTLNYAHGIPSFCVAVALMDGEETLLGVIHDPVRGEVFSACRGGVAMLNGAHISVSQIASLDRAVLGISTHPLKLDAGIRSRYQAMLDRVGPETQHLVNLGSQGLQVAYVAAGRLDGMIGVPADPWSSPAATLIVREAGGTVEPAPGGPWGEDRRTLLATNGRIRERLVALMAAAAS
jgi:myo-inositol-1(or 4)-monophosphatase